MHCIYRTYCHSNLHAVWQHLHVDTCTCTRTSNVHVHLESNMYSRLTGMTLFKVSHEKQPGNLRMRKFLRRTFPVNMLRHMYVLLFRTGEGVIA